jgi:hypothetical protein
MNFFSNRIIKLYLGVVLSIVGFNLVFLNPWGHDPVFMLGPSISAINGEFFKNTLTNYEQNFYSPYLYGIFAPVFFKKGLYFFPFKVYIILNILLIVGAANLLLKKKCNTELSIIITISLVSSSIITGPRCEVLPITLILLIVYIFESNLIARPVGLAASSILFGILPTLHPMAALQGTLVYLWYFISQKIKNKSHILKVIPLAIITFLLLIGFKLQEFILPFISGTAANEMESHSWNPLMTLKFFTFQPLFLVLICIVIIANANKLKIIFMFTSLLVAQLFGRSYYGIYVIVFIVIFLPFQISTPNLSFNGKKLIKVFFSLIMGFNLALLSIRLIQSIENPNYFRTINRMAEVAHTTVLGELVKTKNRESHVWVSYRLTPAFYDIPSLRFYWSLTPELNGLGYIKPDDIFVCSDVKDDYQTALEMVKFQNFKLVRINTDDISSKGLMTTSLRRTDSLKLSIFVVKDSLN